jgi:hypothetical protein
METKCYRPTLPNHLIPSLRGIWALFYSVLGKMEDHNEHFILLLQMWAISRG